MASAEHTSPKAKNNAANDMDGESQWRHVQQLSRQHMNSFKREGSEFSALLASVESSLGGLRQEVDAVKQLNATPSASRAGTLHGSSWPQSAVVSNAGSLSAQQAIEPLARGVAKQFARLSARQQHEFYDAGSRRSSLGSRYLSTVNEPITNHLDSLTAATNSLQDRIYAAMEQALQTVAEAAANNSRSSSVTAADAAIAAALPAAAATTGNTASQQCPTAAAPASAAAEAASWSSEHFLLLKKAVAASAAAEATALAAEQRAANAEQSAQQLQASLTAVQQQLSTLQDKCDNKTSEAAAAQGQAAQAMIQQLQHTQDALQQQLWDSQQELGQFGYSIQQLAVQFDAMKCDMQNSNQQQHDMQQQLKRWQQQQEQQHEAVNQLTERVQLQKQQAAEEAGQEWLTQQLQGVLQQTQDSQDQLLNSLEGLQLRLQSLEEEQEGIVGQQQQHSQGISILQAQIEQQKHQQTTAANTFTVTPMAFMEGATTVPLRQQAEDLQQQQQAHAMQSANAGSAAVAAAAAAANPSAFPVPTFQEPECMVPSNADIDQRNVRNDKSAVSSKGSTDSIAGNQEVCISAGTSSAFPTPAFPEPMCMMLTTTDVCQWPSSANASDTARSAVSKQCSSDNAADDDDGDSDDDDEQEEEQQLQPRMPQMPCMSADSASMKPSIDCEGNQNSTTGAERQSLSTGILGKLQQGMQFTALQREVHSLRERVQECEQQAEQAKPLDNMTLGAMEARLAILEEDYAERQKHLNELDSPQQQQQQDLATDVGQLQSELSRLVARVANMEELQQQMQLAAQSAETSSALLETQPTVKSRIEQFEEQLNAAISRFAPGQGGTSRNGSHCGTPTAPAAAVAEVQAALSASGLAKQGRSELQQQLINLQQEVAQLQAKIEAVIDHDRQQETQQQDIHRQQLLELEAKMTDNSAELREQVLQLELQMQTVEDKLQLQLQQAQVAAKAADAHSQNMSERLQHLQEQVLLALAVADASKHTAQAVDHLEGKIQSALAAADVGKQITETVERLQEQVQSTLAVADVSRQTAEAVEHLQRQVQTALTAADISSQTADAMEQLRLEVQAAASIARSADATAEHAIETAEDLQAGVQQALTAAAAATAAAEQSKQVAEAIEQLQQGVQLAVTAAKAAEAAAAAAAVANASEVAEGASPQQPIAETGVSPRLDAAVLSANLQQLRAEVQETTATAQALSSEQLHMAVTEAQTAASAAQAAATKSSDATAALEELANKVQGGLLEPAAAATAADAAVELRLMVNKLAAETATAAQQAAAAQEELHRLRANVQHELFAAAQQMHAALAKQAQDASSLDKSSNTLEDLHAQVAHLQLEVESLPAVASDAVQQSRDLAEKLPELRAEVQRSAITSAQQTSEAAVAELQQQVQQAAAAAAKQAAEAAADIAQLKVDVKQALLAAAEASQAQKQQSEDHHTHNSDQLVDAAATVAELPDETKQASTAASQAVLAIACMPAVQQTAAVEALHGIADLQQRTKEGALEMEQMHRRLQQVDNIAEAVMDVQAKVQALEEGAEAALAALKQELQSLTAGIEHVGTVATQAAQQSEVHELQQHVKGIATAIEAVASNSNTEQKEQQQLAKLQQQVETLTTAIDALTSGTQSKQLVEHQKQLDNLSQQLTKVAAEVFGDASSASIAEQQRKHNGQLDELSQLFQQLSTAALGTLNSSNMAEQQQKHQQQLDELSQMLFELRVELQTGMDEPRRRLEDLEILEASRKSAVARAEAAAADALEKVESVIAQLPLYPSGQDDAVSCTAQLQQIMQQLQQHDSKLAQQAHDTMTELTQVQQRLQQAEQELQQLQAQQQQLQSQQQIISAEAIQQYESVQSSLQQQEGCVLQHEVAELHQQVQQIQLHDDQQQQAVQQLQHRVQTLTGSLEKAAAEAAAAMLEAAAATEKAKALRDDLEAALAAIGPLSPVPSSLSSPGPTPGFSAPLLNPHQNNPSLQGSRVWGSVLLGQLGYKTGVQLGEHTPGSDVRCQLASPPAVNRSSGLLLTPQASPGFDSSATAGERRYPDDSSAPPGQLHIESQRSRGLVRSDSSKSAKEQMRASIDSLGSPSFKEAAAAAAAYNTVTVEAVRSSVWMRDSGEECTADSAMLVSSEGLQGLARSLKLSIDYEGAAAGGSLTARSNLGESAIFENRLFDNDNEQIADEDGDEHVELVAAGSLQLSTSSLGGITRTPRVADSVMLRSVNRSLQQGFAAAVVAATAADVDAAAAVHVAAAVTAASPLVQAAPLSVYRNATFEEEEQSGSGAAGKPGSNTSNSSADGITGSMARKGLPPVPMAPWSPPVRPPAVPDATPANAASGTAAGTLAEAVTAVAVATNQSSSAVPSLNLGGAPFQEAAAAWPDGAPDICLRTRHRPDSAPLKQQALAVTQGGMPATAAVERGTSESYAARSPLPQSSRSNYHAGVGTYSPHYVHHYPHQQSHHSSGWSSPVGVHESGSEIQHGMLPPSPGLSMAELSIGGPIDLDGSEADSDLLTTRTDMSYVDGTVTEDKTADCTAYTTAAGPLTAAEPPAAVATTAAVVQWQAHVQEAVGSLTAFSSGSSSAEISRANSQIVSEDEYVVEVHSIAAAGELDATAVQRQPHRSGWSTDSEPEPQQQQQQQQRPSRRRQWQPPEQPQEVNRQLSWLLDSSDEEEDIEQQQQQPLMQQPQNDSQQQQQQHADLAAPDDDCSEVEFQEESDDDLPVLRIKGGAAYEPYDSEDECFSEYDYQFAGEAEQEFELNACTVLRLTGGAGYESSDVDDEVGSACDTDLKSNTETLAVQQVQPESPCEGASIPALAAASAGDGSRPASRNPGSLLGHYTTATFPIATSTGAAKHQQHLKGTAASSAAALLSSGWNVAATNFDCETARLAAAGTGALAAPQVAAAAITCDEQACNATSCCSSDADLSDPDDSAAQSSAADGAAAWLSGLPPPTAWLSQPGSFRLALHTSSKPGAGTHTRACIKFTGASGQGYHHQLAANKRYRYHTGSTVQDWLSLDLAESGFTDVRVWHDGLGFRSAWLLDWVLLQHMRSGDWWQYSNTSSSTAGWVKGGGEANAKQLRLSASGIRENCPLPPIASLRNLGTTSEQQQVQLNALVPQAQPCPAVASKLLQQPASAADKATCVVAGRNPPARSANTFVEPEAASALALASSHACTTSSNPFDDNPPPDVQQCAGIADDSMRQFWPIEPPTNKDSYAGSNVKQLQVQRSPAPPEAKDMPAMQQRALQASCFQQHEQWQVLPVQQVQHSTKQGHLQLPAVQLLQAQRCDMLYGEDAQGWSPLGASPGPRDVFAYTPTAEVLELQDKQQWPHRTTASMQHQQHGLQQEQMAQSVPQQSAPALPKTGVQQMQKMQQQQLMMQPEAPAADVLPHFQTVKLLKDLKLNPEFQSLSSSEDEAELEALAAAIPLDDIELKHRGSPRCCQSQQQQLLLRRVHSCEAGEQAAPGSPLRYGNHNSRTGSLDNCTSGSRTRSMQQQLPCLRRAHSSEDSTEGNQARCSPATSDGSSSNSPNPGSPAACRFNAGNTEDEALHGNSNYHQAGQGHNPGQCAPLAEAAACCRTQSLPVLRQQYSRSPSPAGTAASRARRVSGCAGTVKHVPLIAYDDSEQSDEQHEPGYGSAGCSSSSRLQHRLPTPKGSLSGDEEVQCPQRLEEGSAAATAANSLAAGAWQQQQQQGGSSCSCIESSSNGRNAAAAAAGDHCAPAHAAKVVRFSEWAEQLEFDAARWDSDGDSSSVESFTEEQLLEAQGGGEFTSLAAPEADSSYQMLMLGSSSSSNAMISVDGYEPRQPATNMQVVAERSSHTMDNSSTAAVTTTYSPGTGLEDVPLIAAKPTHKAAEYQLKLYTADKLGAGLPAGQKVHLEFFGAGGSQSNSASNIPLITAELTRDSGSFVRGSVASFTLLSAGGSVGDIAAVVVCHKPDGAGLGGAWCLERLEIEDTFKGIKYCFANPEHDGWIGRGRRRAVVLAKPHILQRDDSDALQVEAVELRRQLDTNTALSEEDRRLLTWRLQQLQARMASYSSSKQRAAVGVAKRPTGWQMRPSRS